MKFLIALIIFFLNNPNCINLIYLIKLRAHQVKNYINSRFVFIFISVLAFNEINCNEMKTIKKIAIDLSRNIAIGLSLGDKIFVKRYSECKMQTVKSGNFEIMLLEKFARNKNNYLKFYKSPLYKKLQMIDELVQELSKAINGKRMYEVRDLFWNSFYREIKNIVRQARRLKEDEDKRKFKKQPIMQESFSYFAKPLF